MKHLPKLFLVALTLALLAGLATPAFAADTTRGKIKTILPDKEEFVLTDAKGQDWMFNLGQGSKVIVNDRAMHFKDLKVGDEVTVTYTKSANRFVASEVRSGVEQAQGKTRGQISSVTPNKNEFVLTDTDGKKSTFVLDNGFRINVHDKAGRLEDLKQGDLVEVTYEKRDATFFAKEIRGLSR